MLKINTYKKTKSLTSVITTELHLKAITGSHLMPIRAIIIMKMGRKAQYFKNVYYTPRVHSVSSLYLMKLTAIVTPLLGKRC